MRKALLVGTSCTWNIAHITCCAPADDIPEDIEAQIEEARSRLDLPEVDYEATMREKLRIAKLIFDCKDSSLLQVVPCCICTNWPYQVSSSSPHLKLKVQAFSPLTCQPRRCYICLYIQHDAIKFFYATELPHPQWAKHQ